jgi:spermidine synthase
MKIKNYILEITVFLGGAVVMIFELVGSRILGPYFGTSIFVWTSLIGIIMGSLSLGYYLGGKLADKKTSLEFLSKIIFVSAIIITIVALIKDLILGSLDILPLGLKINSILASVLLFMPASIFLGMISPYAIRLKLINLESSGKTVGSLYAISTLGSIVGTFLSGFFLIPKYGTNNILIIIVVVLVLLSISIYTKNFLRRKLVWIILIAIALFFMSKINNLYANQGLIDIDTAYNRIWIYDRLLPGTNRTVRTMGINNENHSSMFLESNDLVNEYTKYYHLAKHFNPDFKKTLMLGGAGYSFPKDFLLKYPQASIDVVEIDPKVTELAKKYFGLSENPRLNIFHQDGRVFLNKTKEKYDVIFGDAFSSHYSIPYQLTTKEVVQKKFDLLNENGLVILNIISTISGDKGMFLRAEYATYKTIFPHVYIFATETNDDDSEIQNIILVALKNKKEPSFESTDPQIAFFLKHLWTKEIPQDVPVLTDDHAPVDFYINKLF